MVEAGRRHGKAIPNDYIEVNFEELVAEPQQALRKLGTFLDQDSDFERIQAAKLGRLREPNPSFQMEGRQNPVNRWKESLSPAQVADIEALVGDCLKIQGIL